MGPDAVSSNLPGIVSQRFVARDLNAACDWVQSLLKRLLHVGFAGRNARGAQFVYKGVGTVGPNDNFVGMQAQIIRAVFEDVTRREKDESEDDGNHHVVMQSPARMRPEDVALDGLTETQ